MLRKVKKGDKVLIKDNRPSGGFGEQEFLVVAIDKESFAVRDSCGSLWWWHNDLQPYVGNAEILKITKNMQVNRKIMALEDVEALGVVKHEVYLVDSLIESDINCWVSGNLVRIPTEIICYVFDKWEAGRYIEEKAEIQYFSKGSNKWAYLKERNYNDPKLIVGFESDTMFRFGPSYSYTYFEINDAFGLIGKELIDKDEVGTLWAHDSGPREYKIYGYRVVSTPVDGVFILYFIINGSEYEAKAAFKKFVFKDTEEPFGKKLTPNTYKENETKTT